MSIKAHEPCTNMREVFPATTGRDPMWWCPECGIFQDGYGEPSEPRLLTYSRKAPNNCTIEERP